MGFIVSKSALSGLRFQRMMRRPRRRETVVDSSSEARPSVDCRADQLGLEQHVLRAAFDLPFTATEPCSPPLLPAAAATGRAN